jgi:2,5-dihydroxypyridine 5,6-dioxygenase
VDRARVLSGAQLPFPRMAKPELAHPGWCDNLVAASRVAPGERVVVVVDEPLVEEGSQLTAAVRDAGGEPRLELWAGARPLRHAPHEALKAARASTLMLFLSAEPRRDEATARFELSEALHRVGGRGIFLGFVDGALLRGELSQPATDLEETARQLLAELEGSDEIRVRGRAGTDLTLRVGGRPWLSDALPLGPGGFANYPNGEVYVAPHADGADGVLVADLTVPYTVQGLVDAPVTLRFERGRVTSIEGGRAAQILRELVADAGNGADVIAELGIGFNPTVSPRGHVMLDEKAARTAHVAIGRNTGSYGGDNAAEIHVDCVFSEPEIQADGKKVRLP